MLSGKYAEDYRMETAPDSRGRLRSRPVYCGPYFRFCAAPETLQRARRVYTSVPLLCLVAAVVPLLPDAPVTRCWYAALPLALCLPEALMLLTGTRRLLTAGEKVTREHKDKLHDRFALWSIALLICSCVSLAGQLLNYLREGTNGADLLVCACTLLLAAGAAVLFRQKKALLMEEIPAAE